jgi:hypothetical protein
MPVTYAAAAAFLLALAGFDAVVGAGACTAVLAALMTLWTVAFPIPNWPRDLRERLAGSVQVHAPRSHRVRTQYAPGTRSGSHQLRALPRSRR